MNSIRNKRLAIEIMRSTYILEPFNPEDEIVETRVETLPVTLQFKKTYPFHPPKLLINGVDHITKLLGDYKTTQSLRDIYNGIIPCICCSNVVCGWSPCTGFSAVLDEYVAYDALMKRLIAYNSIINLLPFDDNLHSHIIAFLL